jgi:hypothetical protein
MAPRAPQPHWGTALALLIQLSAHTLTFGIRVVDDTDEPGGYDEHIAD